MTFLKPHGIVRNITMCYHIQGYKQCFLNPLCSFLTGLLKADNVIFFLNVMEIYQSASSHSKSVSRDTNTSYLTPICNIMT